MSEPARPSSTLILAREGERAPEFLMVRRIRDVAFGGACVFPGGVLEAQDEAAGPYLDGVDEQCANGILGLDSGGSAYWSAALRETFEETGILLAEPPAGERATDDARRALLAGTRSWPDLLEEMNVSLKAAELAYVGFWITPLVLPKRYSTRFFLHVLETGEHGSACGAELTDCFWASAERLLADAAAKRLTLHFPTLLTVEDLARSDSIDALRAWAEARQANGVPCIFPDLPEADAVRDAATRGAAS